MGQLIGERFVEGRIVNLDRESIENLENMLNEVSKKELSTRNKIDNSIEKMIGM